MTGAEILTKFTADTTQVDKATNNYKVGLGKLTTAFTLANVAAGAISKTIGVISQNMDGAISRFDTMNNFPKVMSNLGIGADEANKSIDTLSERLQGLPTSLDSAAMAVQRLTSKNGNVQESTDMFLALNNAILAGGAGAEIQKSALEQISQAYAKGKPDMMEWRTMMTAMPAQLKQVATAMGYVDADSLGTALRDGSVSMDAFMDTITKLNTEGIAGFENFETQARNATGGIGTSITNMKTAMIRGITTMIKNIDKSLGSFGGLSGVISNIGKIGEQAFAGLGQALGQIIPFFIQIGEQIMPQLNAMFEQLKPTIDSLVQQVMPMLTSIIQQIVPILVQIISTVLPIIIELINMLLPPLLQIIQMILPVAQQLLNSVLPLLKPIVSLIQPIIDVLMAIITPLVEILSTILPPLIDLFVSITEAILPPLTKAFEFLSNTIQFALERAFSVIKPIIENIKGIFKGLTDFIKGVFTGNWKQAWQGVSNIFKNIVDGFVNIFKAPINWIIKGINKFVDGMNKIQIPDWVPGVGGKGFHLDHIPQLNVGTNYVPEDTMAIVHKGEAVIPKKFNPYANGMNQQTIGSMNAIAPNINVIVNANFEQDPLGQMVNNIKTFSGGAKNDYNYGMGR
jgi:tape measure domain-containing protein